MTPKDLPPSLPDRLRQRKSMRRIKDISGAELWAMTDEPDRLCIDAADEIERLANELWELEIRYKMTAGPRGELPELGEDWATRDDWDF